MAVLERLISREEARDLDATARERYGLSTLVLMENAAPGISEEVLRIVKGKASSVAIFCGRALIKDLGVPC